MIYIIYTLLLLWENTIAQYEPIVYRVMLGPYDGNNFQNPIAKYMNTKTKEISSERLNDYISGEYVVCSCDTCNNPKPSCEEFCKSCPQVQEYLARQEPQNPLLNYNYYNQQPNYMGMQYPYQYMANYEVKQTTTTEATTSKETQSTTTKPTTTQTSMKTTVSTKVYEQNKDTNELETATIKLIYTQEPEEILNVQFHLKEKGKYIVTPIRRTKLNLIPNHNLVDTLQYRNMELLPR